MLHQTSPAPDLPPGSAGVAELQVYGADDVVEVRGGPPGTWGREP